MLKFSAANSNEIVTVHLDKYSKVLLTVIASCLVLLVVNIYFSPKDAGAFETVQDVNIKSINSYSISSGYLPVDLQRIEGSTGRSISVDMKSINGRSIYGDKMPVDIQLINGQFFVGSDLPVKVR